MCIIKFALSVLAFVCTDRVHCTEEPQIGRNSLISCLQFSACTKCSYMNLWGFDRKLNYVLVSFIPIKSDRDRHTGIWDIL